MHSPSSDDLRFLREQGFTYDAARRTWVGPTVLGGRLFDELDLPCTCGAAPPPPPRRAMRARRRARRKR